MYEQPVLTRNTASNNGMNFFKLIILIKVIILTQISKNG